MFTSIQTLLLPFFVNCYFSVCYGVECHYQQYFTYIVAVSFIGGGNREYPEKTTNYEI